MATDISGGLGLCQAAEEAIEIIFHQQMTGSIEDIKTAAFRLGWLWGCGYVAPEGEEARHSMEAAAVSSLKRGEINSAQCEALHHLAKALSWYQRNYKISGAYLGRLAKACGYSSKCVTDAFDDGAKAALLHSGEGG